MEGEIARIAKLNRVPNAWVRELCGVKKVLDERIDEGVLRWLGHVEKMENNKIPKRVCIREYAGSRSVVGRGRDGLIPWRSV